MKWDKSLLLAEQIRLEKEMHDGGIARYRRAQENSAQQNPSETAANLKLTRDLVAPLAAGIDAFIAHEREKGSGRVAAAVPALESLPSSSTAMLFFKVVLGQLAGAGGNYTALAIKLGGAIEDQIRFTRVEEAAPHYVKKVKENLAKARSKSYRHQRNVLAHVESKLHDATGIYAIDIDRWIPWRKADLLKLGSIVIYIAMQTLEYQEQPMFLKETIGRQGDILKLNPLVLGWIDDYDEFMQSLAPEFAPCVVPPRDWENPINGGYYTPELNRTLPLVKVSRRKHLRPLTKEAMPTVYQAINRLQNVAWEVNKELLAVINEIQENGGGFGLPSIEPTNRPINPVREELKELKGSALQEAMTKDEQEEFSEWKELMRNWHEAENKRVGTLLVSVRSINAANFYSRYPAIYFVYTMDSRGRVYSRTSTLDPQGSDLQKALIRFHKGKALGTSGKLWLAVQGANTWGYDKDSFEGRAAWVEEHEEMIRDIAADPLTFTDWLKADSPWQFLAWALEFNRLLEWQDSGRKAADFVSHIPVAQDGSCSGTQHYSALLLDEVGGDAVNLIDKDKPQDIYKKVAEVLYSKLLELSKNPVEGDFKGRQGQVLTKQEVAELASLWLPYGQDRELTKRPVMILPYGGTQTSTNEYVGQYLEDIQRRENNLAKLQEREPNQAHPFNQHELGRATCIRFCTRLLWQSISEVVVAATGAMRYIQQVAVAVAKENRPLSWVTPTGFTVTQEVYKREEERVRTFFHGTMICRNVIRNDSEEIDKNKMRSSSAPNFVHSLDASHLQTVAAKTQVESIACIHDSFGTHAADTELLRGELRRYFYEQYNGTNLLTRFKEDAEEAANVVLDDIEEPAKGNLDISAVLSSKYLFA